MPTTEARTAVLTLRSLAELLDSLASRARDLEDRGTDETDRDIAVQLSCFMGVADSSVFSCSTDYADQDELERTRQAAQRASDAWTYLRSGAPAVQRAPLSRALSGPAGPSRWRGRRSRRRTSGAHG